MDPKSHLIGLVTCPTLQIYANFLSRRGYTTAPLDAAGCRVLVVCADHANDPAVQAAVRGFDGPKLVLGADPPDGWVNAQKLRLPLLPLDLEQQISRLLAGKSEKLTVYDVLLVEDDVTISRSVSQVFHECGFTVRACEGFASVAGALQQRPDFILMDLNLPGLSGEKLGEIIRLKHIPVAVFSSEPLARIEAARLRIGGVAAFPKETPLRNVADWIRKYLDGRKPR